jgi:hypothetical protein
MTVNRTHTGCQTRYTLRDRAGLPCTLTFGAGESAAAEWTMVLPGTGSSHPYVMRRFAAPVTVRLRAWLAPIIGPERATELAAAVGTQPPQPRDWQRLTTAAAGLSIPQQRDYRA